MKNYFNLCMKSCSFFSVPASWLTLRTGSLGCIGQLSCVSPLILGLKHIPDPIDVQGKEPGEARSFYSMQMEHPQRAGKHPKYLVDTFYISHSLLSLLLRMEPWFLCFSTFITNSFLVTWKVQNPFTGKSEEELGVLPFPFLFSLSTFLLSSYPHLLNTSHLGKFYF